MHLLRASRGVADCSAAVLPGSGPVSLTYTNVEDGTGSTVLNAKAISAPSFSTVVQERVQIDAKLQVNQTVNVDASAVAPQSDRADQYAVAAAEDYKLSGWLNAQFSADLHDCSRIESPNRASFRCWQSSARNGYERERRIVLE